MKNLFVSYELATLLKEKGFNENCFAHYNPNEVFFWKILCADEETDFTLSIKDIMEHKAESYIEAPMYQEVIDWLMDEHLFFVSVNCTEWMHTFVGNVQTENGSVSIAPCHDYYEALNGAIELALNSIENE
jgi:hypothetical protein